MTTQFSPLKDSLDEADARIQALELAEYFLQMASLSLRKMTEALLQGNGDPNECAKLKESYRSYCHAAEMVITTFLVTSIPPLEVADEKVGVSKASPYYSGGGVGF